MPGWGFLTNHTRVLSCVACNPDVRLRTIADAVGITERAAHRIVCELVDDGYLIRRRVGRRNEYELQRDLPLPDATEGNPAVGALLDLLAGVETHPSPS